MPGTIVWYPQYVALIMLGFLFASLLIWKVNKPLAILSIYCLYSYIFICNQHPRAMLCLLAAYAGIGLICFVSKMKSARKLYNAIILVAVIQFGLVILQKFNLDPFFSSIANSNLSDTVGFVGSHNQLGAYYAAVAPILLHFCMPLFLISILAVVFSACSSAGAGIIAGFLSYAIFMKSKVLLIAFIPILIVGIFMMQKYDAIADVTKARMKIWEHTISQYFNSKVVVDYGNGSKQIVTSNPLTGFGLGSFMVISPKSQTEKVFGEGFNYRVTPRWEHAHNDLIEYLFEFGFMGILILFGVIADIIYKFWMSVKTNRLIVTFCSLIAIAVASCGVYVIHAPVSYFMLCLVLGLFYMEVNYARTSFTQTKSIA